MNQNLDMPPTVISRTRRGACRRGFTLLEMLIAVSLSSLLLLGAMGMLIGAGRATVRTQAQIFATGDAANSISAVITQLRTAHSFALPTGSLAGSAESGWTALGGASLSLFSTTLNGETINTAIEVTTPPTLRPADNDYKAGISDIRVQSTPGGTASGYWAITPYNTQGVGAAVTLIYRGDPDGTPDPDPTGSTVRDAGTYLWQYAVPPDGSFNLTAHPPVVLCKSISTAPNAVQFVRPAYNAIPEQNQVEVKIISGYYSPINAQQTSEESNGASTSQLTGKCVYMRDHSTAGTPANANTRSSNNAFQYH